MTKTILLDNVVQFRPREIKKSPPISPLRLYLQHLEAVESMEPWQWKNADEYRRHAGCPPDVLQSTWLTYLREQITNHLRRMYAKVDRIAA